MWVWVLCRGWVIAKTEPCCAACSNAISLLDGVELLVATEGAGIEAEGSDAGGSEGATTGVTTTGETGDVVCSTGSLFGLTNCIMDAFLIERGAIVLQICKRCAARCSV